MLKEAGRREELWELAITAAVDILVLFFGIEAAVRLALLEETMYYSATTDINLNLGTGGSCGHRTVLSVLRKCPSLDKM